MHPTSDRFVRPPVIVLNLETLNGNNPALKFIRRYILYKT